VTHTWTADDGSRPGELAKLVIEFSLVSDGSRVWANPHVAPLSATASTQARTNPQAESEPTFGRPRAPESPATGQFGLHDQTILAWARAVVTAAVSVWMSKAP
jgi:hypothetical protein